MKLPQLFIPERDINRKIEELKQKTLFEEATPLKTVWYYMNLLYGNSTGTEKERIENDAIEKIIEDTLAGKIGWKAYEDFSSYSTNVKETYKAKAEVIDYKGEEMAIPVMFLIDCDVPPCGYLYLINGSGPCRNSANEKIRNLVKECFKYH